MKESLTTSMTNMKNLDKVLAEFDELLAPDGDTINQILEYRGISDGGKCFKEDEEQHYLIPFKSFLSQKLQEAYEAGWKLGYKGGITDQLT